MYACLYKRQVKSKNDATKIRISYHDPSGAWAFLIKFLARAIYVETSSARWLGNVLRKAANAVRQADVHSTHLKAPLHFLSKITDIVSIKKTPTDEVCHHNERSLAPKIIRVGLPYSHTLTYSWKKRTKILTSSQS